MRQPATSIRLLGLNVSIFYRRSNPSVLVLGKRTFQFCLERLGRPRMQVKAESFVMNFWSSEEGVPRIEMILWICYRDTFPGKSGVLPSSSANMHPTDQTSIALLYSLALSMISGALYHLVTTYSVLFSSSSSKPLANPKSHIFNLQSLLQRRLEGFRSLCIILAEWMQCSPFNT